MPNHFTNALIFTPGHDFDVNDFNERHHDTNFCAVVMPMPEDIEDVPETHYPDGTTESQRQGKQSWYEWAKEHWGTKWGTYDVRATQLGGDCAPVLIEFQTAWTPPNSNVCCKIADWFKRTYKFKNHLWIGTDPYNDAIGIGYSLKWKKK